MFKWSYRMVHSRCCWWWLLLFFDLCSSCCYHCLCFKVFLPHLRLIWLLDYCYNFEFTIANYVKLMCVCVCVKCSVLAGGSVAVPASRELVCRTDQEAGCVLYSWRPRVCDQFHSPNFLTHGSFGKGNGSKKRGPRNTLGKLESVPCGGSKVGLRSGELKCIISNQGIQLSYV